MQALIINGMVINLGSMSAMYFHNNFCLHQKENNTLHSTSMLCNSGVLKSVLVF